MVIDQQRIVRSRDEPVARPTKPAERFVLGKYEQG